MYWDSHMHTSFSFDSDAAPEDQIRRAAEIGLPGICITDHMDFVWGDDQPYLYDADAYCRTLSALREKYADRIRINIGIELGCQAEMTDTLAAALAEHPYDFVIGSTHFAEGMDPYYREYFDGRTNPEGFRAFFERILENLEAFDDFDTLGHLDYVTRYGIEGNGIYDWIDYREIFEAVLRHLIAKDICLEVNTSGFRYGAGPNPCEGLLRFYRSLGGRLITLGADAHTPDRIAYAFDRIGELLKGCGFTEYMVFTNRKAEAFPL
ncbi:MAG: histidinol-phosphatase HisJ family protein [Lachnospiraceae bacterium]|nr:histidinol-phosphatase HisJ family protein [Lachnospiraceae bacterium]